MEKISHQNPARNSTILNPWKLASFSKMMTHMISNSIGPAYLSEANKTIVLDEGFQRRREFQDAIMNRNGGDYKNYNRVIGKVDSPHIQLEENVNCVGMVFHILYSREIVLKNNRKIVYI